jgi:hypothetical protein
MPNLIATRLPAQLTSLAVLAGCATAAAQPAESPVELDAVSLRALGPAALGRLLARWDALPAGATRDSLAKTIDAVAAQRYATTSRMYWYTDLSAASAAAKAQGKPILALRMLGRLDQDLSCANSRLFRTTLYANTEVSAFLRDNFVLYWSSEREVPRVTIDFGDGRKLESTTTGNSAHYVLADDGTVVDVLPGLYAPQAFKAELTKTLALTRTLGTLGADARSQAIAAYHRKAVEDITKTWGQVGALTYIEDRGMLLGKRDVDSALALAQRATISKAYIEVPALAMIATGVNPGELIDETTDQWAAIGQYAWQIGDAFPKQEPAPKRAGEQAQVRDAMAFARTTQFRVKRPRPASVGKVAPAQLPRVLDPASRALVTAVHDAGPVKATETGRDLVIARLEHHLVADSALNQFQLRPQIHRHLAQAGNRSFEAVNTFVYAEVFHTPRQDAWLGLLPRTDFTGLPGDGVVMP